MSTHNICFYGEIRKNFIWIIFMSGVMGRKALKTRKTNILPQASNIQVSLSMLQSNYASGQSLGHPDFTSRGHMFDTC